MSEGSNQLPGIRPLLAEFADPQIEAEYRQLEVKQYGRFAVIGLAILIPTTFLGIGIFLDVSFFSGSLRPHLPAIIAYRVIGLLAISGVLWWINRGLRSPTFYFRMLVFITVFTVWYVVLAYLYATLSGMSQNRFWFAVFFSATIVGSSAPLRYALLAASPLLVGALVLNVFLLDARFSTVVNVLSLVLGTGALATFVTMRLNRGRRLEYAYRENLRRVNEQLEREIDRRAAAEAELRKHKEDLEELVRERTREKSMLEAQLFQAQKVEALGRLAGGVAHDFNNLLIPILNYSEMAHQSMTEDDPLRQGVGLITTAAEKAADLTRQLLAYSRKQAMEARVVDVHQLIDNYRDMLVRLIREDIEIEILPEAEQFQVKGDESQLGQILINTAVNAADAMPNGGKFSIRTNDLSLDESSRDSTLTRSLPPGRYLQIDIQDTGRGMDKATREHIFEPFFTTKDRSKGTGLGLSMVFGIVKQHGGHILVESEPGKGSLFRVFLPLSEEISARPSVAQEVSGPAGGETVLVVEDEEMVRTLLIRMLETNGYNVLVATNGNEAIRLSKQHPDEIHLLLTDLIMPRMNGRQVWEQINKTRPGIRVLYTSGYTNDVIGQHGILEDGTVFMQKPFTTEQLLGKVTEALSRPAPGT